MRLAMKTATYGVLHVAVASTVAYALTGNATAAIGIGLIEPLVQTVVFALHERLWEGGAKAARPPQPGFHHHAAC